MIKIRENLFETNSSSTNVFCIPSTKSVKIPKEIKLSALMADVYSLDENSTTEDKLAFMYNKAEDYGNRDAFIAYLESKGIVIIRDIDNFSFDDYMFGSHFSESNLDNFLFNPDSKYFLNPGEKEWQKVPEDYQIVEIRE